MTNQVYIHLQEQNNEMKTRFKACVPIFVVENICY